LHHFPYVGGHGSIRETVAIPLATSAAVFGNTLLAMVFPTAVYAVALVTLMVGWTMRDSGCMAALFGGLFLVTNPLLLIWSSVAGVDVAETFFIFASLYAFSTAAQRGGDWPRLLAAGALAGLGVLTRETTVFLLATYGVMFLAGVGLPRRWYWVMAIGCMLVVGGELVYLYYMTGNVMYRWHISLNHDSTINRWVDQGGGTPLVHPVIDPFLALLTSHSFGLLFWIGIPLATWQLAKPAPNRTERQQVQILLWAVTSWFLFAAVSFTLLPLLPRYFMVSTVGGAMLTGIAVARLHVLRFRRLAASLAALLVTANLLAYAAENRDQMFAEWALVETASAQSERVHTDEVTARRAGLLLEWRGLSDRVSTADPQPGDLVLVNLLLTRLPPMTANWTVVQSREPAPSLAASIMRAALPLQVVRWTMLQKLLGPHLGTVLYRVP
jgi:4-amino-4-deoxy-L-arabinose transferase-like glycosyltransferase